MIRIFALFALLSSCMTSKDALNDNRRDEKFILTKIEEYHKSHYLTRRPTIIIDKKTYSFIELKRSLINIKESDIFSIWVIPTVDESISHQLEIITKEYHRLNDKE